MAKPHSASESRVSQQPSASGSFSRAHSFSKQTSNENVSNRPLSEEEWQALIERLRVSEQKRQDRLNLQIKERKNKEEEQLKRFGRPKISEVSRALARKARRSPSPRRRVRQEVSTEESYCPPSDFNKFGVSSPAGTDSVKQHLHKESPKEFLRRLSSSNIDHERWIARQQAERQQELEEEYKSYGRPVISEASQKLVASRRKTGTTMQNFALPLRNKQAGERTTEETFMPPSCFTPSPTKSRPPSPPPPKSSDGKSKARSKPLTGHERFLQGRDQTPRSPQAPTEDTFVPPSDFQSQVPLPRAPPLHTVMSGESLKHSPVKRTRSMDMSQSESRKATAVPLSSSGPARRRHHSPPARLGRAPFSASRSTAHMSGPHSARPASPPKRAVSAMHLNRNRPEPRVLATSDADDAAGKTKAPPAAASGPFLAKVIDNEDGNESAPSEPERQPKQALDRKVRKLLKFASKAYADARAVADAERTRAAEERKERERLQTLVETLEKKLSETTRERDQWREEYEQASKRPSTAAAPSASRLSKDASRSTRR